MILELMFDTKSFRQVNAYEHRPSSDFLI